jgi:hypothetical protein
MFEHAGIGSIGHARAFDWTAKFTQTPGHGKPPRPSNERRSALDHQHKGEADSG